MNNRIPARVVKLSVSILFFGASAVRDAVMALFGRRRPGSGVVVYYHAVPAEHRSRFARQMDLVLRWAKPVAAAQRESCRRGERCVAITFDDGFESVLENAIPELERRRIPATVFVVIQSLGKRPVWMASDPQSTAPNKVMSLEQLRNLASDLVTIGSHSLTHPRLTELNESEVRKEIFDSRTQLQNILQRKITLFSFPYGAFTEALVQHCREAGYDRVFTTLPHPAFAKKDQFVSGRTAVEPTDWSLEFCLKISGAYGWLPVAFALKRRLKFGLRSPQHPRRQVNAQNNRESCAARLR